MSFLADLKIRNKLILGFTVVTLFTVVVGFFGVRGIANLNNRIEDLQHNLIPSILKTAEIDRHTQQHRRAFLHYLLERNSDQRRQLAARLQKEERQAKDTLSDISKFRLVPQERQFVGKLSETMQVYFAETARVKNESDGGSDFEYVLLENEKIYEIFRSLENITKELSAFNSDEAREHFEQSSVSYTELRFWLILLIVTALAMAVLMAALITESIARPLRSVLEIVRLQKESGEIKASVVEAIATGDLSRDIVPAEPLAIDRTQLSHDEAGMLLNEIIVMSEVQYVLDHSFVEMTVFLRHNREQELLREWFNTGKNELNAIIRSHKSVTELAKYSLRFLAEYIDSGVAAFYLFDKQETMLTMVAGYAVSGEKLLAHSIPLGKGLAGQAALEQKMMLLDDVPAGYLTISCGLGESVPKHIVIIPLLHNDTLVGVLELGSLKPFSDTHLQFLNQVMEWLAVAVNVNHAHQLVNELLEQTQSQTEELRVQQEELQQTNEELEERAQMLEQQREQIRSKNRDLEAVGSELERRAEELERVSTYKSQFLANMSHELRTPLNSMMILSSLLKDNRDGNLTPRQVEFAATINNAGRDLLNLINDILDLSKIEAGRLDYHYEDTSLQEICVQLQSMFIPIAADKGIDFTVTVDTSVPESIVADHQRIQQILKNLIANACKFTAQGTVSLCVSMPEA